MKNKKLIGKIAGSTLVAALVTASPFAALSAEDTYRDTTSNKTVVNSASAQYTNITNKIKDEVRVYKSVNIDFKDGTAHLTGEVNNKTEKEDVIKRVRAIPGVHSINDDIKIKGESSTVGEYFDDAAVTASVKSKILAQKGLDSLDISVETNGGVVTLTGQVDQASQVSLAENTARQADGAAKVVNKLTVK